MTQENGLESQLRKALDSHQDQSGPGRSTWQHSPLPAWALPGAALASLAAVALGLAVWLNTPPENDIAGTVAATPAALVEMAANDVDIELLEEIEFYDWLMLMQDDGDSA